MVKVHWPSNHIMMSHVPLCEGGYSKLMEFLMYTHTVCTRTQFQLDLHEKLGLGTRLVAHQRRLVTTNHKCMEES